ncbi:MAG TPA: LPXTG cell wall anchor domain-containing protein, partial [Candidatus Limnocylindria bacterium]|nr:LPXTG cell wall anchor domain-containing protein [Candidatus Limnocylindria bacterium]
STGGGTTGTTTGSGSSESTTTGGSTTTDTQSEGGVTVRTETTTVVEGDQQVRIIRIFRDDVLVNEIRTPLGAVAGFESAPTGQVIFIVEGTQPGAPGAAEAGQQAGVLGQQSAPAISQLPSTSTAQGAGGLAIGIAAMAIGLAMLRRRSAMTE